MGTTSDKLTYLATTKTKIKDAINLGDANITTETFRQYEKKIKQALINTMLDKWGIWDNFEKVTGTNTSLSLSPTSLAPISIDLKGNTQQDSTTGKNKLYFNEATSVNGVTFTPLSNGKLKINGTSTDIIYLNIGKVYLEANTDYTFSISYGESGFGPYLNASVSSGSNWVNLTTRQTTFQVASANTYNVAYYIANDKNVNQEIELQIEKGSSVTSFEKYSGGSPSPNPDYPQEIHNVSGDNTIVVEGKQLLKYPYSATTTTTNGITFTDNGDGTILAKGIATGNAYFNFYPNTSGNRLSLKQGTYTFSNNAFMPSNCTMNLGVRDKNGNAISGVSNFSLTSNAKESTRTINQDFEIFGYIYIANGTNINDGITLKPMLEKGNQSSTYTPYVSQSQLISLGVENLLPTNENAWEQGGISSSDGTNITNTARLRTIDYYPIKNDIDYYVSVQDTNYCFLNILLYNSSKTYLGDYATYIPSFNGATSKQINIISSRWSNVAYMRVVLRNSDNTSTITANEITTIKPQIELGTKKNSFTPYGTTPIELNKIGNYQDYIAKGTGKNLFDKDNINGLDAYLDTTNNKIVNYSGNKSIYIACKPNTTYTISKTPSKRFGVAYTYTTPANNVAIYGTITNYDGASITITTDTNAQYLVVWVINSNISGEISYQTAIDTLQIEVGGSATPFEPYGFKDKWYLHKEIGKYVLTGGENETWQYNSSYTFFWTTSITNIDNQPVYTNYYLYNSSITGITGSYGCSVYQNTFRIKNTDYTQPSDLKTWLQSHNTIVYYVLATPQEIEITDSTLISQLEAIKNMNSYDGTTNISQENNDLPFILDVTSLEAI